MNESLYLNKICFQEEVEKTSILPLLLSFCLSILFFLSCILEIQLTSPIYAVYQKENSVLIINYNLNNINDLLNMKEIEIEKQRFPFQILNMSEILYDNQTNQNFQKVELYSPNTYLNNQVIQIKLLDKKERIILKIFRWLKKEKL
ncbi:MAG: hypothetical protein HFI08_05995 [Bacilli bacterium]|nr:hypothetical protein [Bacilli bacterium]